MAVADQRDDSGAAVSRSTPMTRETTAVQRVPEASADAVLAVAVAVILIRTGCQG
jgi:hypothetical protein